VVKIRSRFIGITPKLGDANPNINLLSHPNEYIKKANEVKAGRLDSRQMIDLLPQRKTD
jgi:hypothetical protein